MRYRFIPSFFALAAALALTPDLISQNKGKQAAKAPPPSNLPFDPRDISGIWKNPGGFNPVIGNDRPPMTAWGKEKWSKTRASARNSPLAFGFYQDQKDWNDPLFQCDPSGYPRNLDYSNYRFVKLPDEFVMFFERDRVWRDLWTDGRKLRVLRQSLAGTDIRLRIGMETPWWWSLLVLMNDPGSILTAPSIVTRCVSRSVSGASIMTTWNSA